MAIEIREQSQKTTTTNTSSTQEPAPRGAISDGSLARRVQFTPSQRQIVDVTKHLDSGTRRQLQSSRKRKTISSYAKVLDFNPSSIPRSLVVTNRTTQRDLNNFIFATAPKLPASRIPKDPIDELDEFTALDAATQPVPEQRAVPSSSASTTASAVQPQPTTPSSAPSSRKRKATSYAKALDFNPSSIPRSLVVTNRTTQQDLNNFIFATAPRLPASRIPKDPIDGIGAFTALDAAAST